MHVHKPAGHTQAVVFTSAPGWTLALAPALALTPRSLSRVCRKPVRVGADAEFAADGFKALTKAWKSLCSWVRALLGPLVLGVAAPFAEPLPPALADVVAALVVNVAPVVLVVLAGLVVPVVPPAPVAGGLRLLMRFCSFWAIPPPSP